MRFQKKMIMSVLAFCLAIVGITALSNPVYAKKIVSMKQAAKMARQTVKNGGITEMDRGYEHGVLVYEIQLMKGSREYEITYRASDGKMLSYGWEEQRVFPGKGKKSLSKSDCEKLARKKVSGGTIQSLVKKYDDGIPVYKVKVNQKNKKYTLKYHGKTGELIEYEWKLAVKASRPQEGSGYIGTAKAKKIALSKAPKAAVVKVEFDRDDGVPVYEVELVQGAMEYEIKIHARTGKVLEIDRDYRDYWQ